MGVSLVSDSSDPINSPTKVHAHGQMSPAAKAQGPGERFRHEVAPTGGPGTARPLRPPTRFAAGADAFWDLRPRPHRGRSGRSAFRMFGQPRRVRAVSR